MTRSIPFLFALTLIAATGCAPVAEENLDEAWETTSYALMDAESKDAGDGDSAFASFGNGDILDGCPDGGSIDSKSQVDLSLLDVSGGSVNAGIRYQSTFSGCKVDGTVIDGTLDWTVSVGVDDDVSVEWNWAGTLNYSGEIVGSCDIDMDGAIVVDSTSASIEYAGTYCGYDAASSLRASTDSVLLEASSNGNSFLADLF